MKITDPNFVKAWAAAVATLAPMPKLDAKSKATKTVLDRMGVSNVEIKVAIETLAKMRAAAAARNAKAKAALVQAGGRRLTVNLGADAAKALALLRKLDGTHPTDRAVIERLLLKAEQRLRKLFPNISKDNP